MAISLKPEEIFTVGNFPVTNSLLTFVIISGLLLFFALYYSSRIKVKPNSKFQLIIESIVIALYDLAKGIMGDKVAKIFFPFIFTFFSLILLSNWFGLLPFVGSIGYARHIDKAVTGLPILVINGSENDENKINTNNNESKSESTDKSIQAAMDQIDELTTENTVDNSKAIQFTKNYEIEAPFFRSPSADMNFTLALAVISFLLIQAAGLKILGLSYLGKFFDYRVKIPSGWKIVFLPFMFLINVLWKTLELVLELGKIISFTFRLFGNIFAGEVLLFVITSLTFGLLTLPFIGLEVFVGFVQAIVFSFLTMVFIRVASESHSGNPEHLEDANVA